MRSNLQKKKIRYNVLIFIVIDPIDGWTKWTDWGSCDINCQKHRERFCEGSSCTMEKEIETLNCDSSCMGWY